MKLANPACRKARKCQPFCGMCNLQGEMRLITNQSLFGACRALGRCVCKTWSETSNCYWINGRNVHYKSISAGTYDCSAREHPQHHKYNVASWELDDDKQSKYNKMARPERNDYKEIAGLYGGYYLWRKK